MIFDLIGIPFLKAGNNDKMRRHISLFDLCCQWNDQKNIGIKITVIIDVYKRQVNENVKVVEIHRVLRGSWNLPQYLE